MIAILLTMQNHPETSIKAYWTSKHVIYPFTRHMGLCRFEALLRHVKIYPSTEKETYPRLNEWSSHIQQAMANTYTPGSHVAVDECIQGFTGRSALKTTIPNKPTPVGFKLWALAQAGLFLRWIWHVPGKGPVGIKKRKTAESLNPTQQVVVHLLDKLPNAPYHIFLDNLFISPKLFKMLRHKGIGTSGTSRINSGIFSELVDEKKKPDPKKHWGWIRTVPTQDGLVNQFAWKDAEIVLFLSTVLPETDTVLVNRRRPAKNNTQAKKKKKIWEEFYGEYEKVLPIPTAINEYNHNMGYVDVGDQLRASYNWGHRWCRGVWQPLTWGFLLAVVAVNSYLLDRDFGNWSKKATGKEPRSHIEWRGDPCSSTL
ncbi:hypothetical protein MAJ_08707, partial [Metarhizium majus ARSEF 297]